jgi:hypothetical protein
VDRGIFVTSFMTAGLRICIFASINRQTAGRVPMKFVELFELFPSFIANCFNPFENPRIEKDFQATAAFNPSF